MKKIGVIGTGKTGSAVAEALGAQAILFNRSNPPAADALRGLDGAIVFVTPDAAEGVMQVLLDAGVPVAWGTTGFALPESLDRRVRELETSWVTASNFSMGMILMKSLIEKAGELSHLLGDPEFVIRETHHVQKKDRPSGTALHWGAWLGHPVAIHSERIGDVIGSHSLTIRTGMESITLTHEANDRALFAMGAIRALKWLLEYPNLRGVYDVHELAGYVHGQGKRDMGRGSVTRAGET